MRNLTNEELDELIESYINGNITYCRARVKKKIWIKTVCI
jgi:hypothetical protein